MAAWVIGLANGNTQLKPSTERKPITNGWRQKVVLLLLFVHFPNFDRISLLQIESSKRVSMLVAFYEATWTISITAKKTEYQDLGQLRRNLSNLPCQKSNLTPSVSSSEIITATRGRKQLKVYNMDTGKTVEILKTDQTKLVEELLVRTEDVVLKMTQYYNDY